MMLTIYVAEKGYPEYFDTNMYFQSLHTVLFLSVLYYFLSAAGVVAGIVS